MNKNPAQDQSKQIRIKKHHIQASENKRNKKAARVKQCLTHRSKSVGITVDSRDQEEIAQPLTFKKMTVNRNYIFRKEIL